MFPGDDGIMTSGVPFTPAMPWRSSCRTDAERTYRICRLHHLSAARTAHTRTASPTPFSACSPAVLEPHPRRRARQRADRVRHQHLARRRQPADARGDVDGAAVDVVAPVRVFLARHVAGVQAEMQGQTGVIAGPGAAPRRLDRLARRREHRQDSVAQRRPFDRCARALPDHCPQRGVELPRLRAERRVAEALGKRGGVGDVGEEDDGLCPEGSRTAPACALSSSSSRNSSIIPTAPSSVEGPSPGPW